MAHRTLISLGIRVDPLIAGRPAVRGQSGYVLRWGEGWFEEIRDGGPGWRFPQENKSALDLRINLLLDIFQRRHSFVPLALVDSADSVQAAISDLQGVVSSVNRDHGPRDL